MLYLFRGADQVALREALAELCQRVSSDPALRELNVTRLDGAQLSLAELSAAADTWPFLAERRVVVVDGLSRSFEPRTRRAVQPTLAEDSSAADDGGPPAEGPGDEDSEDLKARVSAFSAYLRSFQERSSLPAADGGLPCDVVLVETGQVGTARRTASARRQSGSALLAELVRQAGGQARVFAGPQPRDLATWIRDRARRAQVVLDDEAIELLATTVGSQTELLETELGKLRTYAGAQPVGAREVRLLVPEARAANVFELGDKVAQGDRAGALALLDHLAHDGEHPLRILALLVRHFRQLVQASEAVSAEDLARRAQMPPWAAERAWRQARRCPPDGLRAALAVLLAADGAVKQGRCEADEALLLAVLRLSDRRTRAAGPAALGRP